MTDSKESIFAYSINFSNNCLILIFKVWKPVTVAPAYSPRLREVRQQEFHMIKDSLGFRKRPYLTKTQT